MKNTKLTLLFLLSMLMLTSMGITSAAPEKLLQSDTCDSPTIILSINQGYYADTDNDGLEDDVFVETHFRIQCANRANFDYYITLTLPSGKSFTYGYRVSTRMKSLTFNNNFYDHAQEMGDYQIDVLIVLKTGGIKTTTGQLIFDPPGGSNSDPKFSLSWY